jgi:hypothetical protein
MDKVQKPIDSESRAKPRFIVFVGGPEKKIDLYGKTITGTLEIGDGTGETVHPGTIDRGFTVVIFCKHVVFVAEVMFSRVYALMGYVRTHLTTPLCFELGDRRLDRQAP